MEDPGKNVCMQMKHQLRTGSLFELCGAARGWHNVVGDANRKDELNATEYRILRRQAPTPGFGHGAIASWTHMGSGDLDYFRVGPGTLDIRTRRRVVRRGRAYSEGLAFRSPDLFALASV